MDIYSFTLPIMTHSSGLLMQENHYYPYGMLMEGLSNAGTGVPQNMYRYTDKEMQNDLNQHFLDFGWRQYDPVIARWHVTDPAEQFYNPYLAIGANPVSLIDPDGRKAGVGGGNGGLDLLPTFDDGIGGGLFGGGGGGNGMGIGSLASLNPYDMQQLANSNPLFNNTIYAITSNGATKVCSTCGSTEMQNGAVIISDVNSGSVIGFIDGANGQYSSAAKDQTLGYNNGQGQVDFTSNVQLVYQDDGNGGYWKNPVDGRISNYEGSAAIIQPTTISIPVFNNNFYSNNGDGTSYSNSIYTDIASGVGLVATMVGSAAQHAANYIPKYATRTAQAALPWLKVGGGALVFGNSVGMIDNFLQMDEHWAQGNKGYAAINGVIGVGYLVGTVAFRIHPVAGIGISLGTGLIDFSNTIYRKNNP